MSMAGSIEVAIKALGTEKFAKQVQNAIDKMKNFGSETAHATPTVEAVGDAADRSGGKLGKFAKLAEGAAAAAAAFAGVKFAHNLAATAQQAQVATQAFKSLGGNLDEVRKATGGMVSDATLVKKANLAQTMGINNEAFMSMAQIAQASAAKTGQSMEYLFESIIVGSARQSRLILDNLGIIINVEGANQKWARANNKVATSLSDVEKKQAFLSAVMEQGNTMMKEMSDAGVNLIDPFTVFGAQVENASDTIGRMLIPVFSKLFTWMNPLMDLVARVGATWDKLNPAVKDFVANMGALGVVAVAIPIVYNAVLLLSKGFMVFKGALLESLKALRLLLIPMLKVALIAGVIVSAIGIMAVAWEENWGGIQQKTASAWKAITEFSKTALKNVLAGFYFLRDGALWAFSNMGQGIITALFFPVQLVIKATDSLLGAFTALMRGTAALFAGMGMDTEANTFMKAAESLEVAMGRVQDTVRNARDELNKRIDVKPPSFKQNQSEAETSLSAAGGWIADKLFSAATTMKDVFSTLREKGGAAAGQFIDTVEKGWKIIFDKLGLFIPDGESKQAGKKIGSTAAGFISDEVVKARAEFRGLLEDLRNRDLMKGLQDPFRTIKQVSMDLGKEMRNASEKALKAGMGMDEARMLILRNAGREYAERVNGISNLAQWNQAVLLASDEAKRMGVDFNDVASNLRFKPTELSDILTGRVAEVFDVIAKVTGLAVADGDKQSIVEAISKGISGLLKDGKLDWDLIGKSFGALFGGTGIGSDFIGKMLGVAKPSGGGGAAGQAASMALLAGPGGLPGLASILGGAGGGAAAAGGVGALAGGMSMGPVGGLIGTAVAGMISMAAPIILEAFQKIAEGMLNAAAAIPEAISGAIQKLVAIVPNDKFKSAMGDAFSPMVVGIGLFVGALVAAAPAILLVLGILVSLTPVLFFLAQAIIVLVPILTLVAAAFLAVATFAVFVLANAIAAFVTIATIVITFGALLIATAALFLMLFTPVGLLVVLLAATLIPVIVLLASVLLVFVAVASVVIATIGLFIAFLKLAAETKSFERFKAAFEGSIGRVVKALEPFFENLMAFAGLFDALTSIVLPLAIAFANNEQAARILFEVVKAVAIVMGVLILAVGYFVSALLAGVILTATGLSNFIKSFQFVQSAVNGFGDALMRAGSAMLQAIQMAFVKILPESMTTMLGDASRRLAEAAGSGQAVTGTTSALDAIAAAAQGLSPDLNAMGEALAALTGLTYDEATTRAAILAKEKQMNESMTNMPQGFKVVAARFRAIRADQYGTGALPGDDSTSSRGGNNFFIDRLELKSDDPEAMADALESAAERRAFQQTGTTSTRDHLNNGT